jgi:hypothetical protein
MSGLKIDHINLTSRSLIVKESDWTSGFDHEIIFDEECELWNPSSCNYLLLIVTFAISQHPVFKHPLYYYPIWDGATPSFETLVKPSDIKILLHILRKEEDKTILKWIWNIPGIKSRLYTFFNWMSNSYVFQGTISYLYITTRTHNPETRHENNEALHLEFLCNLTFLERIPRLSDTMVGGGGVRAEKLIVR